MKTFTLGTTAETERYDYLSRLSMDRWAWEFARRNTELLEDARTLAQDGVSEMKAPCENTRIRLLRPRTTQTLAERWGLVFMPDPKLNGFEADVVWSHYVFPHQVIVHRADQARHARSGTAQSRIVKSHTSPTALPVNTYSCAAIAVWFRCAAPANPCWASNRFA